MLFFPTERQKESGSGGEGRGGEEELGRVEGAKTVIRLYCMRKEFIFNYKKLKIVFSYLEDYDKI